MMEVQIGGRRIIDCDHRCRAVITHSFRADFVRGRKIDLQVGIPIILLIDGRCRIDGIIISLLSLAHHEVELADLILVIVQYDTAGCRRSNNSLPISGRRHHDFLTLNHAGTGSNMDTDLVTHLRPGEAALITIEIHLGRRCNPGIQLNQSSVLSKLLDRSL